MISPPQRIKSPGLGLLQRSASEVAMEDSLEAKSAFFDEAEMLAEERGMPSPARGSTYYNSPQHTDELNVSVVSLFLRVIPVMNLSSHTCVHGIGTCYISFSDLINAFMSSPHLFPRSQLSPTTALLFKLRCLRHSNSAARQWWYHSQPRLLKRAEIILNMLQKCILRTMHPTLVQID